MVSNTLGHPLNLKTPLADALQPALSILVNTGYTNVQTPFDGGTYNRVYTSADSGTPTPFLSQSVLTTPELLALPRNLVTALVYGFQKSFPVLRFGQGDPTLTATVGDQFLSITHAPVALAATHAAAAAATVPTTVAKSLAGVTSSSTPTVQTFSVNTSDTTSNATPADDTSSTGSTSTGGKHRRLPVSTQPSKTASPADTSADAGGQPTQHPAPRATHQTARSAAAS